MRSRTVKGIIKKHFDDYVQTFVLDPLFSQ